jgi:hypothetical protein
MHTHTEPRPALHRRAHKRADAQADRARQGMRLARLWAVPSCKQTRMYVWRSIQIERSRCSKLESQVAQLKSEVEVSRAISVGQPPSAQTNKQSCPPRLGLGADTALRGPGLSRLRTKQNARSVRCACELLLSMRSQDPTYHAHRQAYSKQASTRFRGPTRPNGTLLARHAASRLRSLWAAKPRRAALRIARGTRRMDLAVPTFSCGRAPARAGLDRSERGGRACSHPPRTAARRVAL